MCSFACIKQILKIEWYLLQCIIILNVLMHLIFQIFLWINQLKISRHRCSIKKVVLKNFAKFTRKHLYQSLFCNKVAGLQLPQTYNFIKKGTLAQMFSCEFCEIFKNTFFTEHLWTTDSRKCLTVV